MVNLFQRRKFFRGPPPPPSPSYSNLGGTGNRTAIITISVGGSFLAGTTSSLIDGALATGLYFSNGGTAGDYIQFDFGSSRLITELRWINNAAYEHGVWKMQGSDDGSSFTDLGSSFTLGSASSATSTHPFDNETTYRYYRLTKVSGSNNLNPWLFEAEFKIL